jgi:DCN1-like protein 1/2
MDYQDSNVDFASSCQRLSLKRKRREPHGIIFGNGKNPLKRACSISSFQHFSLTDLGAIFNHYSCGTELIESKGMLQFCRDLNVDTMDVALLVLSYQLSVAECGVFTKQEFVTGLSNLGIYSMYQLQEALPSLREYALTHLNDIYTYAFHSLKEYESQLTIPLDGALEMIRILTAHLPHGQNFIHYMKKENHEYLGMNYDQWTMFLQFNLQITMDFENYDENGCWPVMIDDFVLYMRSDDKSSSEEPISYYESNYDNQCFNSCNSPDSSSSGYSPFSSPFKSNNNNINNVINNNSHNNNLLFSTFNSHMQNANNIYSPFDPPNSNNFNHSYNLKNNNINNNNNYFNNNNFNSQNNNSLFSSFNTHSNNNNHSLNNNSHNNNNNINSYNNIHNNYPQNNSLFSSYNNQSLFSHKEESDSCSEVDFGMDVI